MMKIVAGLGSIDDYIDYVNAGADEVFVGFVPRSWQEESGLYAPLNRREVCFYNVQIGSESELEILSELVEQYKVPVTLAFNGLNYSPEQIVRIMSILESSEAMGYGSVILADPAVIHAAYEAGLSDRLRIHVSGELGEVNHFLVKEFQEKDARRWIFHRKVSVKEMESVIRCVDGPMEYEAFVLNENCHYHGGYCNSLHCDELVPMCRMPYRVIGNESLDEMDRETDFSVIGAGGCGLCALWDLEQAGVTHLKVVGRGACSEDMIRDIKGLKKALEIMEQTETVEEFINEMKEQLFLEGCSKDCYYF